MAETQKSSLRFRGLNVQEVEESRKKHGPNIMTPPERDPWWKQFLEKFDDPVIRILIIAAFIAIGTGIFHGEYIEGLGIIIAVLLATTLAFINEFKANKEFDILNKVNDEVPIKVIRDGNYTTVPRKDLVVGDVVIIEIGEETPADGRILEAMSLQVDESRFTGESLPVKKVPTEQVKHDESKEDIYAADKILRGSMIVDGYGIMEVTGVGDNTESGKIAKSASEDTGETTPLNQQLERLSKVIGVLGFGIAMVTFIALAVHGVVVGELVLTSQQWVFTAILMLSAAVALVRVWLPIAYDGIELLGKEADPPAWLDDDGFVGWLKTVALGALIFGVLLGITYATGLVSSNHNQWIPGNVATAFLKFFMIAVTIIVVAVPEGLAMSVTLSLAYSMRKMTASNNLVRRMHACETIGAATVICSDKTGTLTMNEMRVHEVNFPSLPDKKMDKELSSFTEKLITDAISVNSTGNLSRKAGEPTRALGNPTEGALLLWLDGLGVDYIRYRTDFSMTKQWTFSTERKYMATVGKSSLIDKSILHAKGAPEILLGRCSKILTSEGVKPLEDKPSIEASIKDYQARGMRSLGFAYMETDKTGDDIGEICKDMIWLGFVAIADPVRPEVPDAIKTCGKSGIKVKVVTGDNSATAQEIARQINLWTNEDGSDKHITGQEFEKLDDEKASEVASNIKIMSRARPMDKMRLVKLLHDKGEVVAVTGDGTNDAPALNYADVGLAMGKTGTSVAKEASDIILLDDSFRSIVNAVMWGRSLYQNIQRFVLFQLTINVVACIIAMLGPFINMEFPLTVIQMLWVNLIMDTFAALALATEPPHWNVMERPPRKSEDFIVTKEMSRSIFGVGIIFIILLIGMIYYFQTNQEHTHKITNFMLQHCPELSDDKIKSLSGLVDISFDDENMLRGELTKLSLGQQDIDFIVNKSYTKFTDHELSIFFTFFVLLQFWNLFNARCLGLVQSAFKGMFENKGFVVIAGAILMGQILIVQFGGKFFRTVPLSLNDWLIIIGSTSLVLWIGEIWRLIARLSLKKTE